VIITADMTTIIHNTISKMESSVRKYAITSPTCRLRTLRASLQYYSVQEYFAVHCMTSFPYNG